MDMTACSKPVEPKTKQEFLRILDTFFASTDVEGEDKKEVWDILSALRGPDDDDLEKKLATTAILRAKVFPNGREWLETHVADIMDDCRGFVSRRLSLPKTELEHFVEHARMAFRALGLKWDKENT